MCAQERTSERVRRYEDLGQFALTGSSATGFPSGNDWTAPNISPILALASKMRSLRSSAATLPLLSLRPRSDQWFDRQDVEACGAATVRSANQINPSRAGFRRVALLFSPPATMRPLGSRPSSASAFARCATDRQPRNAEARAQLSGGWWMRDVQQISCSCPYLSCSCSA